MKMKYLRTYCFLAPLTIMMVKMFIFQLIQVSEAQIGNSCNQDYSPCTCTPNGLDIYIDCIDTPIEEVIRVFKETQANKHIVTFSLLDFVPNELGIPDNILGDRQVIILVLQCKTFTPLLIANDSFKETKYYTSEMEITGCNLFDSNMGFLEGFNKLLSLKLDSISNMALIFPNFPIRLSAMTSLTMTNCHGWENLTNVPATMFQGKLKQLYITNSKDMVDEAMDIVMKWVLKSFEFTMENLFLYNNNLNQVPHEIQSLSRLGFLDLKNNFLPLILTDSFIFIKKNPVTFVDLSKCGVNEIQPHAFQGNFKDALIDLQNNNLTRIESSVFEDVLQGGGEIDVKFNPFNCEDDLCHLAWLFNGNMTNLVLNARCSNGTFFEDLDRKIFVDCLLSFTTELQLQTETINKKTVENSEYFTAWTSRASSLITDGSITFEKTRNAESTVSDTSFSLMTNGVWSPGSSLFSMDMTSQKTTQSNNTVSSLMSTTELPTNGALKLQNNFSCNIIDFIGIRVPNKLFVLTLSAIFVNLFF